MDGALSETYEFAKEDEEVSGIDSDLATWLR